MKNFRFRFRGQDDLLLLQRVRACEPYLQPYGESEPVWVKCTKQLRELGLQLETRTVRDRFYLLYRKFMAKDRSGLYRGSTETEALHKESILQEICNSKHPELNRENSGGMGSAMAGGGSANSSILNLDNRARMGSNQSAAVPFRNNSSNLGSFAGINNADGSSAFDDSENDKTDGTFSNSSSSDESNKDGEEGGDEEGEDKSKKSSRKRKEQEITTILKSLSNLETTFLKRHADLETNRLNSEKTRLQNENLRLQTELEYYSQIRKRQDALQFEELTNMVKFQSTLIMSLMDHFPKSNVEFSSLTAKPASSFQPYNMNSSSGLENLPSSSSGSLLTNFDVVRNSIGNSYHNAVYDSTIARGMDEISSKRSKKSD